MPISEKHTGVLIVGAGPSGLMMAAQLLRNGVQPVIIDTHLGPTNHSKALAVQARSLEIYRQMGIVDKILSEGKQSTGVVFKIPGKKQLSFSFKNAGDEQTKFPYIMMYQQSKNERFLLDYLTKNCCPVYWNTSVITLQQDTEKVTTILKTGDEKFTLTCDYIIGADGAHSTVRKQSQIPFNGDMYQHKFYLADVKLDNHEMQPGEVNLYLGKKDFAGFFPMPETDSWRIIGNLPAVFDDREELQIEEVLPYVNEVVKFPVKVAHNNWFTLYRLHHRMADSFRAQRCFLVGDAAHIHSPVGGQGMNTGLQDAYNLAWKIAGVVKGQFTPIILDSYTAERMPVAKDLLNTTDRVFTIIMSKNWFISLFKINLLPSILKFIWSKESFKKVFFKIVSQTLINYRDSAINLHLSNSTKIKAGDRLPYLKVFDEKKQEETDLQAWCSKPGFTLIALGKINEADLFNLAKWITDKYAGILNFYYLPPSGRNKHVFERFEVGANQGKALIVRPDMYLGFINDKIDMYAMDNYFKNVLGVKLS